MGNKILVDTDFLFALLIENDAHHTAASGKIQKNKNDSLYITSLTIPETVTVLSHKVSQEQASQFLSHARKSNFTIINLDEVLQEKTDQIFLAQKKKGTSWVDCLNVAAVQIHHLDGILSFDRFYQKAGIKVF